MTSVFPSLIIIKHPPNVWCDPLRHCPAGTTFTSDGGPRHGLFRDWSHCDTNVIRDLQPLSQGCSFSLLIMLAVIVAVDWQYETYLDTPPPACANGL